VRAQAKGAAIGAGPTRDGNSTVGLVRIEAGDFLLNGSFGAGIGAGFAESANSSVGVVSVKNSRVDATGMNSAGIGAGSANDLGVSTVFNITLGGQI
jgi:hypothetical protein